MTNLIVPMVSIIIGLSVLFSLALTGLPVASVFYLVKAKSLGSVRTQNDFRRRSKL